MRVAVVHDSLIQKGGAEKLLSAICRLWPGAVLFSSIASNYWQNYYSKLGVELHLSWMQKLPFKSLAEKIYFPFYSIAFSGFDFSDFDVVISSSARFAHHLIIPPSVLHICYCNSPGRMFWQPHDYFQNRLLFRKLLTPWLSRLRIKDWVCSRLVDSYIANAGWPQKRIHHFYKRSSRIIHPFVNVDSLSEHLDGICPKDGPFLVVSRLVGWKRVDLAIKACAILNFPLVVVGDGPDRRRLEKYCSNGILLAGRLTDSQLKAYYESCRAVIITQEEDFGLVSLEAQAHGKPVIAYGKGGSVETVAEGETGLFFKEQSVVSLVNTLKVFDGIQFLRQKCFAQAKNFSYQRFAKELEEFVIKAWQKQ